MMTLDDEENRFFTVVVSLNLSCLCGKKTRERKRERERERDRENTFGIANIAHHVSNEDHKFQPITIFHILSQRETSILLPSL